jgi:hypothetical protein
VKKVLFVLALVFILASSSMAYSATGGHVPSAGGGGGGGGGGSVTPAPGGDTVDPVDPGSGNTDTDSGSDDSDVSHGQATKVDPIVADTIGAHPIVPSDSKQTITDDHVKNEIAPHFDNAEIHFLALPPLTGGLHGQNVTQVDHQEFTNFTAENIRLFLRHHEHADGETAYEIQYAYQTFRGRGASEIPVHTYAFVDKDGLNPSPVATATSDHLLLHIQDNDDYDHDRKEGSIEVHPQFAEAKISSDGENNAGGDSSSGSGGGGCDTGIAPFISLLLAGVFAIKTFKKSRA